MSLVLHLQEKSGGVLSGFFRRSPKPSQSGAQDQVGETSVHQQGGEQTLVCVSLVDAHISVEASTLNLLTLI